MSTPRTFGRPTPAKADIAAWDRSADHPPAPYDGQVRCILFAMKGLPSDAGRSQKVKVVLSIFIKDLPDRRGPLKLVSGEQMLRANV